MFQRLAAERREVRFSFPFFSLCVKSAYRIERTHFKRYFLLATEMATAKTVQLWEPLASAAPMHSFQKLRPAPASHPEHFEQRLCETRNCEPSSKSKLHMPTAASVAD